jgi:hypothetical protein
MKNIGEAVKVNYKGHTYSAVYSIASGLVSVHSEFGSASSSADPDCLDVDVQIASILFNGILRAAESSGHLHH